jgi:hypothetical protein
MSALVQVEGEGEGGTFALEQQTRERSKERF